MKANRRTNTKPEVALRKALWSCGLRFRKDHPVVVDTIRVRVDVAFTRRMVAVFVDGCFWHAFPTHGNKPMANAGYWAAKLARNQARDVAVDEALGAAGWTVVRLWEHESIDAAVAAVKAAVGTGTGTRAPARSGSHHAAIHCDLERHQPRNGEGSLDQRGRHL